MIIRIVLIRLIRYRNPLTALILLLIAASGCSQKGSKNSPIDNQPDIEQHKGMAYFVAFHDYNPTKVESGLKDIKGLNCNWVSLDVALLQLRADEPEIYLPFDRADESHPALPFKHRPDLFHHYPTDADIRHFVSVAHRVGLKVMFKPHVHPEYTGMRVVENLGMSSDPMWPGTVHVRRKEDWRRWFGNYSRILEYYVENFDFDALCIGDELSGTYSQERHWRNLISRLRKKTDIPLTCAFDWWVVVHHQKRTLVRLAMFLNLEDNIFNSMLKVGDYKVEFDKGVKRRIAKDTFSEYPNWTDALDYVGLNFYFPLSNKRSPSLEELKRAWHRYEAPSRFGSLTFNYVEGLKSWKQRIKKPILFTEGGWAK